jgi:hypothetical protein
MKRKKYKPREGNIKDDVVDPFPKTGLVKQFEPYIRGVVGEFAKRYPRVRHQDFLFRAVELALAAEKTFKPELGNSFATHLCGFARDGRLKELHRLYDKLKQDDGVEIYRTAEDLAHEQSEEEGEPTDPVNFAGGGNGIRLIFDLQWWETLVSDIVNYIPPLWSTLRHRLKLGLQLRQSDNAPAVQERISADLPLVIRQQPRGPILLGWIRAVIDHLIRRQREADNEAEKRPAGDYSPTFLEAARNAADVKFYKGRKPPRFLPKYMPMARLDDAYGHNNGGDNDRLLHEVIADAPDGMSFEQEMQKGDTRRGSNKAETDKLDRHSHARQPCRAVKGGACRYQGHLERDCRGYWRHQGCGIEIGRKTEKSVRKIIFVVWKLSGKRLQYIGVKGVAMPLAMFREAIGAPF